MLGEATWSLRATLASALGLAAVALLVRSLARPGRPMWLDESITLSLAQSPLPRLFGDLVGVEANGGLYTLLLAALLRVAGPLHLDALALSRGLSAAFGCLVTAPRSSPERSLR